MADDGQDLMVEINRKLEYGESLISRLSNIIHIDGAAKLQRKIKQELSFLKKVQRSGCVKREQLSSSNLRHLGSLVECAVVGEIEALCRGVARPCGGKLNIDLVGDQGRTWTKVIARNPKSLSALCEGNASYGARSVLDQAKDYLECASMHPCFYQTPQVVFEFVSGIEDVLAAKLEEMGVIVHGTVIPTEGTHCHEHSDSNDSDSDSDADVHENNRTHIASVPLASAVPRTLNLDVSTMMAYVSNLTNGHCDYVYRQPLLSQQALWEAKRPVKPMLDQLFQGCELVCCEVAWSDMSKIVEVLGGEQEKRRTAQLRERLTIMPDDTNSPDDACRASLSVKGRVRLRSKTVFNFGQRIRAVTVSANEGFVRAAKQQGVSYATVIHESRALTEQKEETAKPCQLPRS